MLFLVELLSSTLQINIGWREGNERSRQNVAQVKLGVGTFRRFSRILGEIRLNAGLGILQFLKTLSLR